MRWLLFYYWENFRYPENPNDINSLFFAWLKKIADQIIAESKAE